MGKPYCSRGGVYRSAKTYPDRPWFFSLQQLVDERSHNLAIDGSTSEGRRKGAATFLPLSVSAVDDRGCMFGASKVESEN